jgi:hypothetical protein
LTERLPTPPPCNEPDDIDTAEYEEDDHYDDAVQDEPDAAEDPIEFEAAVDRDDDLGELSDNCTEEGFHI